jgi:hypothetical protein
MLTGEAAYINFIVLGLTRPVLEPTIYCTGFIDGVMDSVLASSAVDRGFIDGVMENATCLAEKQHISIL